MLSMSISLVNQMSGQWGLINMEQMKHCTVGHHIMSSLGGSALTTVTTVHHSPSHCCHKITWPKIQATDWSAQFEEGLWLVEWLEQLLGVGPGTGWPSPRRLITTHCRTLAHSEWVIVSDSTRDSRP